MKAPYVYFFEKLEVRQLARQLSEKVYELPKGFPSYGLYSLTSQINGLAL
ncbi:hypothetical protein GCM10028791_25770 [Echinicola sediminis]